MLFTFISACNNTGKEEGAEMEGMEQMEGMEKMEEGAMTEANTEGMPAVLVEYINIKNALVKDNYEQAKQAAAGNSLYVGNFHRYLCHLHFIRPHAFPS